MCGYFVTRDLMKVNKVDSQTLQIYQHMCPLAFRCLRGFNEMKEKQFKQAAADNRYY